MPTNLKRIRKAKGLTQQDVFKPAGIAKSYYSALENGKRDLNARLMSKLSKVLKVEPYMLLIETKSQEEEVFLTNLSLLSGTQRDLVRRLVSELVNSSKK